MFTNWWNGLDNVEAKLYAGKKQLPKGMSSTTPKKVMDPHSKVILVVVDVNNIKNGRKPVKLQKESPAGCAREGKQSKGN